MTQPRTTTSRPTGSNADPNATNANNPNPTTDRLASMAHETVDRVADTAHHAEQEVRDVASRTAKKAKQAQEHALDAAEEGMQKVKSYVEQNPMASAGIAFAAGLILSSLIRR